VTATEGDQPLRKKANKSLVFRRNTLAFGPKSGLAESGKAAMEVAMCVHAVALANLGQVSNSMITKLGLSFTDIT
jgi:hypothetical protein